MGGVESAAPAHHIVILQGVVHPLPEIRVLHGHHLPKELPSPAVGSPFRKAVMDPLPDVVAAIDDCHAGGLIESLQGPNDRQQIESLAVEAGLGVGGLEPLAAIVGSQNEPPLPGAFGPIDFREQQIVRGCWVHCCLSYIGDFEGRILENLSKVAQPEKIFRRH